MVILDSTQRFSGKAIHYNANRPTYPASLVDWLYEKAPCNQVCDIAAGTGIFTKCLLKKPWNVTAVEPNQDMLEIFRNELPEIPIVQATGENTSLPAGSFGLVTIAQAFHWVHEELFQAECERLLTPTGSLAIVWNTEPKDGISMARAEVFKHFCPLYHVGHSGKRPEAEGDLFIRTEYLRDVQVYSASNPVHFNEESFVGEALSRSYALTPGDEQYQDFLEALHQVFLHYSTHGQAIELYEAVAYLGNFR